MSKQEQTSFDWAFWFLWIMATTWGWLVGWFLVGPVGLVASGVALGILQWLVLKQRIRNDWQWIVTTAIGWALGWGFFLFAVPSQLDFVSGLTVGLATGIAQWSILRREVHWAGWWLAISPLAWTAGLDLLSGGLLAGALPGAISGIALALLLRYPKPDPAPEASP